MSSTYIHIKVEITDQIGVIKLNRPHVLNAWNETMLGEMVAAFRELDAHPETIFTVLTGEGRFFSAGADIRENIPKPPDTDSPAEKKLFYMRKFSREMELFRLLIHHAKILILALNGPAAGGGAAWFTGVADIVLAAAGSYIQIPFSSLGLVPEFGAVQTLRESMGVHRANEVLMFGRRCTVEELEKWGVVNVVLSKEGFEGQVLGYLRRQLDVNDPGSMLESKRLMSEPLRKDRVAAMVEAADALAERFVSGVPFERFRRRNEELERASQARRGKGKASL
ncbi:hypothetical protein BDW74DRAFT_186866 [Aspergillus multicolor]|uniref:enoyl-CoA hydratase/isomerase family protein n=1 Tax=Aspergillus multicolor TaxID=41759 RepID=UPI003CCDBE66